MGVNAILKSALAPLPWPSSQHPAANATDPIYLTWQELTLSPTDYASNVARRTSYLVQVNVFSRAPVKDAQLRSVLDALTTAGVTVQYAGPRNYEDDTKLYHVPITCRWQE